MSYPLFCFAAKEDSLKKIFSENELINKKKRLFSDVEKAVFLFAASMSPSLSDVREFSLVLGRIGEKTWRHPKGSQTFERYMATRIYGFGRIFLYGFWLCMGYGAVWVMVMGVCEQSLLRELGECMDSEEFSCMGFGAVWVMRHVYY